LLASGIIAPTAITNGNSNFSSGYISETNKKYMLLIIDNQNAFIKKFEDQYLSKTKIPYHMLTHNQPVKLNKGEKITGIMLSGGRGNPFKPLNLTTNFIALSRFDVPVMGFCLGHEIIAVYYGGQIDKLAGYYTNREPIKMLDPDDAIFSGMNKNTFALARRHSYHVSELPEDFIRLAESKITPNEIIRHNTKPIYGFQGHPEASGKTGLQIMKNFFRICGYEV
jgi:GMP synthase (glutamine-hydrolysing)